MTMQNDTGKYEPGLYQYKQISCACVHSKYLYYCCVNQTNCLNENETNCFSLFIHTFIRDIVFQRKYNYKASFYKEVHRNIYEFTVLICQFERFDLVKTFNIVVIKNKLIFFFISSGNCNSFSK